MAFDPSWYEVLNALSGVLFILLGILVGRVQAGGSSNRAFALFAIAFGTAMVILNLLLGGAPKNPDGPVEAVSMFAASLFSLVSGMALVWLWRALPRESPGPRGRSILIAAALLVLYGTVAVIGAAALGRDSSPWLWMFLLAFQFQMGAMWGLCAVCAFRFRASPATRGSGYAIMAAALAIYPAFWGGIQYASGPAQDNLLTLLGAAGWLVVPVFLIAMLWLYVGAFVPRPTDRTAFAVAWISLGAALAGLLAAPPDDVSLHTHWGYGVSRILSVGLLGFAILRGQAPGIDGTLRFGVSRSMVAAAFVAVFFIASEGAQMVVGQDTPLLGLLAAGALVFAMAPLQKAADRFAERAVPVDPRKEVDRASHNAVEAYRHALRAAMRDGKLARREERHLAELARTLGLDSVQALALREEVENEST